jgi:hypothetical protein
MDLGLVCMQTGFQVRRRYGEGKSVGDGRPCMQCTNLKQAKLDYSKIITTLIDWAEKY